jgi:hypothetical protein
MRRAVLPRVLPSPFSEPPGLVKLQASIPAPPAIEGLLTRAHLARHLCPAVKPLPGSIFASRNLPTLFRGVLLPAISRCRFSGTAQRLRPRDSYPVCLHEGHKPRSAVNG